MKNDTPIAVTSRSFSRHPVLRAELEEVYSNVKFNDEGLALQGKDLIEYCRGREKMITALETINEPFLSALPELKIISKYGVGTDMLDKQALINHGIKLGWTGGVNRRSVTELVISCAISLLRHIPIGSREASEGGWQNRMGKEISDRTVGIIGCGFIGKDLTPILNAFGCKVLAHDILDFPEFYAANHVEAVSLDELLQRSDIVTLHLPLDDSTRDIITAEKLALMKSDSIIINHARGGLINEKALKIALQENQISAAAIDAFVDEPPTDLEMLSLPNLLVTPHIGGSSEEAILAMGRAAIAGLDENKIPTADYPPAG